MKIGIFYEHQLPRPWSDDSEVTLIQNALEQCELADKLGIDYVWEVEHHFLEEYSHSSAPEVFLGAVSQRTKRIRLGHGIVQTPPPFNHPARVAERIAMLDLVSNGRADFGSGESSSEAELGGFQIDPLEKRAMWEEGPARRDPVSHRDALHRACRRLRHDAAAQRRAQAGAEAASARVGRASRRETIHLAAENGIGALAFAFINPEEALHWINDYYTTLASDCVPIGDAVNPNVACVSTFMCHEDEDEAMRRGLEGANFFGYSLAHYYVFGHHRPGETDVWDEYEQTRAQRGYAPEAVEAASSAGDRLGAQIVQQEGFFGLRGAIGTPDQIRDYLERYEEAGVDQVIFCSQSGKNRHEDIMESLELFGRDVLPAFIDRDEQLQKEKAQRLEPVIEAAMARKPASDHPPLADAAYEFPGMPSTPTDRAVQDALTRLTVQGTAGPPVP